MEVTKKTIAGIVTFIMLLSSGTTWYIQDLGTKTGCRNGWDYVNSGEFEGQYACLTQSSTRYETCFEVYNSTNTENYWCKKGELVEIEKDIIVSSTKKGERWDCRNPKGSNCTRIS